MPRPATLSLDGYELDGLTIELEEDVDSAVSFVDEPTLYEDPWRVEVPPLRWAGNGAPILSVAFEATRDSYSCDVTIVGKTLRRSWRG